tara:strand:+ start:62 stop:817 length:756 start_codon:yes stop_codon:yes gene_type:complete
MAGVRPERLTVSNIKSRLLNTAQSSLYRLTLSVPQAVRSRLSLSNLDYDNLNLLCCEATLPGSSLTTHEVNNDYHGATEKMAYRRLYDETIGLTFYVDRDYKIIELLEGWMDYITGIDNKKQYEDPYISYRMSYPNSYKNNIYLTKFERDHFMRDHSTSGSTSIRTARTTLDYTFVQAFPMALTAIPVSYDESSILKCSVSFNFIRYVQQKKQSLFSISDVLGEGSTRDMIVNRDPNVGAPDLSGTTANVG